MPLRNYTQPAPLIPSFPIPTFSRSSHWMMQRAPVLLGVALGLTSGGALAEEDPAATRGSVDVEAEAQSESSAGGSVFVDPLGLLMFGPTAGGEIGFGKPSVSAYLRWLNGGFLARQMFPDEEGGEAFAFSWGAGIKGRYYLEDNLRGVSAGIGVEYLRSRIEDDPARIATIAHILVPQAELGYRYALGSFFVGGAGALGYALELDSTVENLPGGTLAEFYEVEDFSTVYGSVGLELGIFL